MQIRYFNTKFDLVFGGLRIFFFKFLFLFMLGLTFLIIGFDVFSNKIFLNKPFLNKISILLSSTIQTFIFFLFIYSLLITIYYFLWPPKGAIGEHSLIITENALIEKTEFYESNFKWNFPMRVYKTFGYYLIFCEGVGAHVISTRRPLIEGELEEFFKELSKKLNENNKK